MGNFRIAILIMLMKRSPCFHNSSATGTDAKYESAQTILYVLAYGSTSSFSTFVPWGIYFSSYSWYTSFIFDLTILSRIIIPARPHAAFYISAPLSGFLSIATYIGKPKLIQLPTCPYHRNMDSLAQMISKVDMSCVRYSLKLVTNSSTSFHRWASWCVPSSHTSGWWLHQTCLHSILKRCIFVTAFPKSGADL